MKLINITVLLFILIGFGLLVRTQIKLRKKLQWNEEETYQVNKYFENRLLLQSKYFNNFFLPDTLKIQDKNGIGRSLSKICDKPILFFRYTIENCNACVEAELERLFNSYEALDEVCIAVLITNIAAAKINLKVLQNRFKNKLRFYEIPQHSINRLDIENLKQPYYFILEKSGKFKYLFVPDIDKPRLTESYFNFIKNDYAITTILHYNN